MRLILPMAVIAICLGMPRVTWAQGARAFDVSGAYVLLQDRDIDETLPGWLAAASYHVAPILGITGEIGVGNRSFPLLGTTQRFGVISLMAGPRVTLGREHVTVFGHVLVGSVRLSTAVLDHSASRHAFAWQPGGGADFWLTSAVGLRLGADYRRFTGDVASSHVRLYAGAVLGARN